VKRRPAEGLDSSLRPKSGINPIRRITEKRGRCLHESGMPQSLESL
jgi:hypothetical protein